MRDNTINPNDQMTAKVIINFIANFATIVWRVMLLNRVALFNRISMDTLSLRSANGSASVIMSTSSEPLDQCSQRHTGHFP